MNKKFGNLEYLPGYDQTPEQAHKEIMHLRGLVEELEAYKADIENSTKMALDESCTADEKHCTCVPLLRKRVAELEAVVERIRDQVNDNDLDPYPYQRLLEIRDILAQQEGDNDVRKR